ncbi:MAG UNVERIFIED_CONTAM: hypothetical protein LVR18_02935 [Planctomycetaceae bacterium]|jgi:hypothetical protein
MNVSVESFFTSNDFAIRRSSDTLQDSTGANVDVDLLTLGAENLTAFAGLNGDAAMRSDCPSPMPDLHFRGDIESQPGTHLEGTHSIRQVPLLSDRKTSNSPPQVSTSVDRPA